MFDRMFREREFISKLMTLAYSRAILKTVKRAVRCRCLLFSLADVEKERKRDATGTRRTRRTRRDERERRKATRTTARANQRQRKGGKRGKEKAPEKKGKGRKRETERDRERQRERGRIWKKTELLRAPRTKHCRPRNTAPPPPRLLSILKCYVPGIASCGSHPLHPPPPNLYGSPFSSMHVKFALSDQRLRLPSSPRVLTDEGKRPSFV